MGYNLIIQDSIMSILKQVKYSIVALGIFLIPQSVSATQSVHHDYNEPYDCLITGNPQDIQWVKKGDKSGNKQIKLKWYDSKDAHDVEIEIAGKGTRIVPDDGIQVIKKLKKGKNYEIRMRGVSNCGEGNWTRVYRIKA